jgi:hypothetical protein
VTALDTVASESVAACAGGALGTPSASSVGGVGNACVQGRRIRRAIDAAGDDVDAGDENAVPSVVPS